MNVGDNVSIGVTRSVADNDISVSDVVERLRGSGNPPGDISAPPSPPDSNLAIEQAQDILRSNPEITFPGTDMTVKTLFVKGMGWMIDHVVGLRIRFLRERAQAQ